ADFDEAIRLGPKYARFYAARAAAFRAAGNEASAAEDERKAHELSFRPTISEPGFECLERGIQYLEKGAHEGAITQFTEAIRLDPKNSLAYIQRGIAQDAKGEPDLAIADFTEAIRVDPQNAVAYSNRGNTYSNTGQYEQAIADYTE